MSEAVRTVGRYGVVRELGRGGMAVVHLARQTDLDRLVALKELAAFHAADPDFVHRFLRESRLAGSLVHPNVVTVFDYFEDAGVPYIAMEYVARGSLRPYVGRMSLAQIGGVLEGLLAGLAEAERQNIVHRDLKPENLMVTNAGGVKIADFGIAKATVAADTGAFVTATGATVGTPAYMAPEQAMAKEIGPWTDLYAVGCVAYELFTGRPPFADAGEPMAIMVRHITEPLPPAAEIAGVDPDVSGWIEGLTMKEPTGRPASATAAWDELEGILIARLGPRWRRDAPLGDAPLRVPGPATPPPAEPLGPIEGIDLETTAPDTPQDMSVPDDDYETYHTPPQGPPVEWAEEPAPPPEPPAPAPDLPPTTPAPRAAAAPERAEPPLRTPPPTTPAPVTPPPIAPVDEPPPPATPAPFTPPPVESEALTPPPATPAAEPPPPAEPAGPPASAAPLPPRAASLARAGAVGILAVVLVALVATGVDRWNLFAAFSPFEAVGIAVAAFAIARGRVDGPLAAGVLTGLGALALVAALALLRFTINRLDALAALLAVIALAGAAALLAAGRAARSPEPPGALDPAPLVLGLAGAALATVSLFVTYDGFSSLWSELQEGDSAEFFLAPAAAAAAIVAGLALLGSRPRFAAGLLLAAGGAAALGHLGLLVAAWRAIGEVGDVRAAGFIGLLGGLLALAAGAVAARRP